MKRTSKFPYIHAAGYPFIAIFAAVTFLFYFMGATMFFIGLILTGWCVAFFRDPPRTTPVRDGLVISPADGRIVAVSDVVPEPDLGLGDETRTRISIFLNVFNVHVNRVPVDGKIVHMQYRAGKFVNASLDKASVDNERMAIAMEIGGATAYAGQKIGIVQIAGLIARRILCDAEMNEAFKAGERYGLIRFGSRTDVYLPVGAKPLVSVGQHMLGGETILADFASQEQPRSGEVR